MTDVLGALLIGLVVGALTFSAISSGFMKSKIGSTEQDLVILRMQVQQLFANSNGYTGLDNAGAIKNGLVPKSLIKGDDIRNTWGGPVTISANAANSSFTIDLEELPHEACVQLSRFQPDAWFSVEVNGNTIDPSGEVLDATGNCYAGNVNQIVFEAR
jgi:type II secretory pathway pseudopilin PulG